MIAFRHKSLRPTAIFVRRANRDQRHDGDQESETRRTDLRDWGAQKEYKGYKGYKEETK